MQKKKSPDMVASVEVAKEPLEQENFRKPVEETQAAQLDCEVMGGTPAPLIQSDVRKHQPIV